MLELITFQLYWRSNKIAVKGHCYFECIEILVLLISILTCIYDVEKFAIYIVPYKHFKLFVSCSQRICRKNNWTPACSIHPMGCDGRLGQLLLHFWQAIWSQTIRSFPPNVWQGITVVFCFIIRPMCDKIHIYLFFAFLKGYIYQDYKPVFWSPSTRFVTNLIWDHFKYKVILG